MSVQEVLKRIDLWMHRLHSYVGLCLLLFVWLFAFSGLLLNHHWAFSEFWADRRESVSESSVRISPPTSPSSAAVDLATTRDLMAQLGVSGEIDRITAKPDTFGFRVAKPGQIVTVTVDVNSGKASVKNIRLNTWGVLSALHHLTGVHGDNPELNRNNAATALWSLSVDAVSVGSMFLVVGGVWLWLRRKQTLIGGTVALLLGLVACGLFLFAL